jgi:hypothetical protein
MAWFWGGGFLPRLLYGCMPKDMCFDRSVEGLVELCVDWLWYLSPLLYALLQVGFARAMFRFRSEHTEVASKVAKKGNFNLRCLLATWQLLPFFLPGAWKYAWVILPAWAGHSLLLWFVSGAFAAHLYVLYWEVIAVKRGLRFVLSDKREEEEVERIIHAKEHQLNQEDKLVFQHHQVVWGHIKLNQPLHAVRHDYIDLLQWYTRIDKMITKKSKKLDRIKKDIANANQQNMNPTDLQKKLDKTVSSHKTLQDAKPNLYALGFVVYTLPWRLARVLLLAAVRFVLWVWSKWSQLCMTQRNAADYQKYLALARRA